jgi:hypothetical protein
LNESQLTEAYSREGYHWESVTARTSNGTYRKGAAARLKKVVLFLKKS